MFLNMNILQRSYKKKKNRKKKKESYGLNIDNRIFITTIILIKIDSIDVRNNGDMIASSGVHDSLNLVHSASANKQS